MKLSKLKNIIRESLNDLIVEQDFIAGGPFLPLAYPTTTVDQGNDIAHVVIRDCSSELPVYSQPACLNNHSQYEIGHQFKFYDVFNNIRTGYLESIVTQGSCPSATLGAGQYLFNPIEDPYVGACEGNPNSTYVAPMASMGGIDPDADFFDSGAGASINNVTGESEFSFPSGFNPASWADGWISNIYSFFDTGAGGGVPFANAAQVVPNACSFFASRVQTWTNQYSTAGPLYQNQLVFKLQLAYAMQDYFDCSEAPFDNYSFPFNPNEGLNEQMERSLPGNLKSIIDRIVQKVDQRLRSMIQKPAEPTKPATFEPKKDETDRLKKLANIPIDKPMDMPEKM